MFPAFLVRVKSGQQGKIVGASLVFTAEFSSIGAVWSASFSLASFGRSVVKYRLARCKLAISNVPRLASKMYFYPLSQFHR